MQKFRNNLTNEIDFMNKRGFTRFEFKMGSPMLQYTPASNNWWHTLSCFNPYSYRQMIYREISNISPTKSQNLNDSRLVLQLPLPNPLMPCVKSRTKMWLEQRVTARFVTRFILWLRHDLWPHNASIYVVTNRAAVTNWSESQIVPSHSAGRRCSNYIWVINKFIAYECEAYIRYLTVGSFCIRINCISST